MSREFDLLDGGWYASQPFDDWAWMREHAPAYWDAKNEVWALTRHADVLAVEKDPATFSSQRGAAPARRPPPDDDLDGRPGARVGAQAGEPRVHARGASAITKRRSAGSAREIIDRVAPRGECDFVWDIAAPLPLLLIADMLGFPPESYDDLLRWSDDLIRATDRRSAAGRSRSRRWRRCSGSASSSSA